MVDFLWLLVHLEIHVVRNLNWNEIFIDQTYWFSAWKMLSKQDLLPIMSYKSFTLKTLLVTFEYFDFR